HSEPGGAY
nr:RecName: Full=Unknown protein from 2D-PAGE of fibroblasts; AltName: Full=P50 [Mus musculus]